MLPVVSANGSANFSAGNPGMPIPTASITGSVAVVCDRPPASVTSVASYVSVVQAAWS